jgi:hypothetical protein
MKIGLYTVQRRRRSEGIGTLIQKARRDMDVIGQLHAQADLVQSSSSFTHQVEGLLGSGADLEI